MAAEMAQGVLMALEGIDGSGKSTQAELLAAALRKRLRQEGRVVVLTREPTDGITGQQLRRYLQGPARHLSPEEELELFVADRREHVDQIIRPALEAGKIVVTDRYYYSSAAYQGALGLDPGKILALNESFAPRPHLVFVLELPVNEAMARLAKKGKEGLQLSESQVYLSRVAAIYATLKGPQIRRLDAGRRPEVIHQELIEATRRELQRMGDDPAIRA
jgi:dTMP kinase